MRLTEVKEALSTLQEVNFHLPNGEKVPEHFHVTEVGVVNKHFIDCGGTVRKESVINFQLFTATDFDHRLSAEKLISIIHISEKALGLDDLEIEVEHQGDTIGKYGLEFNGTDFLLTSKQTDCLAKDNCGIPTEKPRIRIAALAANKQNQCEPNSGCC
ncbi:DUF6428 family protein [Flammeovirgaceae bacterium SG7u.111]|nr:DUF6428 family protein [Flammeovirgaceae bacterium SG7u.132]WPO35705.1 DUF6428 family protein [Flammeovirgaceae bacterium SG7u.111]